MSIGISCVPIVEPRWWLPLYTPTLVTSTMPISGAIPHKQTTSMSTCQDVQQPTSRCRRAPEGGWRLQRSPGMQMWVSAPDVFSLDYRYDKPVSRMTRCRTVLSADLVTSPGTVIAPVDPRYRCRHCTHAGIPVWGYRDVCLQVSSDPHINCRHSEQLTTSFEESGALIFLRSAKRD